MPAGGGLGGTAALKNRFGAEIRGNYGMCFKKRNGQRRDGGKCLNSRRVYSGKIAPLPVNGVMLILEMENTQGLIEKSSRIL